MQSPAEEEQHEALQNRAAELPLNSCSFIDPDVSANLHKASLVQALNTRHH